MAIFGLLLTIGGGIGAAWFGLFLLFCLAGVLSKKIAPNKIKDEYYAQNLNTLKQVSIKFVSGLVALGIGLIIINIK